jgi:hypothetical protein
MAQNSGCLGAGNGYVGGDMTGNEDTYPKRRRSASADAALRAEIQRVEKVMEELQRQ